MPWWAEPHPDAEPWDEDPFDPDNAPPDGDEAFLADLPSDLAQEFLSGPWAGDGEAIPAGFLHRQGGRRGSGFAAGGVLDGLVPGPVLAGFVAGAAEDGAGLPGLGESELIGVLCAAERMASWAAAQKAESVITLCRRRAAQARERKNKHLIEHVADEVAAALTLTRRAASRLVSVCGYLERLPAVRAALAAGVIDWARAVVFADELAGCDDEAARKITGRVLPRAGEMTTAQLRRALRREVEADDPDAARRRRERGRKDAAVHRWDEPSGNSALAGREMTPADATGADARLTAQAKWLRARGVPGSLDRLREAVFAAVLNGRDITTLLPAGPGSSADASPGGTGPDASATPHPVPPGGPAGGPSITGSVHLTMPLSAWLWLTDRPGEVAGSGTADADTCRDLADRLAAHPATKWCLTLTDLDGHAVAHACARHGPLRPDAWPGPPRSAGPHGSTGPPRSAGVAWAGRAARTHRISRPDHGMAGRPAPRVPPDRYLHPPPRGSRLPAAALPAPPDHRPPADLRRARLPASRSAMRHRPHNCIRPGRTDVRMQLRSDLPPRPPGQAGPRLAPRPARARRHDLDPAQRPHLHHPPRPLPHLAPRPGSGSGARSARRTPG